MPACIWVILTCLHQYDHFETWLKFASSLHFDYCSSVWAILGSLGIQASKLQNSAARIITGSYTIQCLFSWDLELAKLGNLEKRRSQQFGVLILMYKTMNKMVPNYRSSKFTPTNVIHNYNFRHSNSNLFLPRSLTELI